MPRLEAGKTLTETYVFNGVACKMTITALNEPKEENILSAMDKIIKGVRYPKAD